jgi:hypothetical protein
MREELSMLGYLCVTSSYNQLQPPPSPSASNKLVIFHVLRRLLCLYCER